MNKVMLVGRLTDDPAVTYSKSDVTIAKYVLAVRRTRSKEEGCNFIRCVCFGKSGDFAEEHFTKGMRIAITGHIQTGRYENEEGHMVYTTDIIVEEQEFADGFKEDDSKRKNKAAGRRNRR